MGIIVKDGNSNPINVSNFVIKHGSHNQADHGRGKGGAGAGGEGSEGNSSIEIEPDNENRMWATETAAGKKGVAEVETAAKEGNTAKIESVRNKYMDKADKAEMDGNMEAFSSLSAVADYANDLLGKAPLNWSAGRNG